MKEIVRRDGRGTLAILPARDVMGAHGKTYLFVGFDEIHGYRDWAMFEALAPDPTRPDALTWIATYDTIWSTPGVPLFDLKRMAGTDPRMLFSWYSADLCTDPDFAELAPEERANPSMARGLTAAPTSSSSAADCPRTSSAACISTCQVRRMALSST